MNSPDLPLSQVIAAGNRRDSLEAIRNLLGVQLQAASGREAAVVARELREVIRELSALGGAEVDQVDALRDELEERRKRNTGASA